MSRRDRLVIQFMVWLAIGTFLFGIWTMVVGIRKATPAQVQRSQATTNAN